MAVTASTSAALEEWNRSSNLLPQCELETKGWTPPNKVAWLFLCSFKVPWLFTFHIFFTRAVLG